MRIIFMGTAVDDQVANIIQAQLLFLESVDARKDIQIYLNSPGGGVYAGLGIYDTMQYINCDVATICTGMAASFGAVLLCAGAKGKRSALKHARVMIHQPLISGQIVAPAIDIKIHAEEIKKTRQELNRIIADTTGQPLSRVEKDTDRDYYLDGKGAVEYGLADKVLTDLNDLGIFKTEKKEPKAKKGK